jgi:hypothetical protein
VKGPTIKPSDLRTEAQRLSREGKMPTLKQVLDVFDEVKRNPAHVPCATSTMTQRRCLFAIAREVHNENSAAAWRSRRTDEQVPKKSSAAWEELFPYLANNLRISVTFQHPRRLHK